jgi:hypothetical protein
MSKKFILFAVFVLSFTVVPHVQAVTSTNVGVFLVKFANVSSTSYTPADAAAKMLELKNYYTENSYGLLDVNYTILGWYNSPINLPKDAQGYCLLGNIRDESLRLATEAGVDVTQYDRYIFSFSPATCTGPNAAHGGEDASVWVGWSDGIAPISVWRHEFGHTLPIVVGPYAGTFINHAHSLSCGSTANTEPCTHPEYGDPFDVMGTQPAFHFNAIFKYWVGWLTPRIVTESGTYTLAPLSTTPDALMIDRGSQPPMFMETRRSVGFDVGASTFGVRFHQVAPGWHSTDLLDMTPGDGSFFNSALVVGACWTDPYTSTKFRVLSGDSTSTTIDIQLNSSCPPPVATTTTILSDSPDPSKKNQSYTVSWSVTPLPYSGTVTVTDDKGISCSASVGSGFCTLASTTFGTRTLTATYSGNNAYLPSSDTELHTVNRK